MREASWRRAFCGSTLAVLLAGACGARTELETPERCGPTGQTRPCSDACGTGEQLCDGGLWQACKVPVATRACADGCGQGEERCEAGAWQGCRVPEVQRVCSSACGEGVETCRKGKWGSCSAPQPKPPKLSALVRDFREAHPDFETERVGVDPGIVDSILGPDDKPVYRGAPTTPTTSGRDNFDQWYRDVEGVNLGMAIELQLQPAPAEPGFFVYEDTSFFPIDGELFGNEGHPHNYHFTLEASTRFKYVGGEVFRFTGDDDMWVFINRRLAIDLGGLHASLDAMVELDQIAAQHALEPGGIYELHFFFAERHTVASNFTIRTSIADQGSCE